MLSRPQQALASGEHPAGQCRVLIVDPSPVRRRGLSGIVEQVDGFRVAGTATSGAVALSRLEQLNPGLVILDLELAAPDLLTCMKAMRTLRPMLPILLLLAPVAQEPRVLAEALLMGAADVLFRPGEDRPGGGAAADLTGWLSRYSQDLRSRIHSGASESSTRATLGTSGRGRGGADDPGRLELITLVHSTGGTGALYTILSQLPALAVPMVISTPHSTRLTELLAGQLDSRTSARVQSAVHGTALAPESVTLVSCEQSAGIRGTVGGWVLDVEAGIAGEACGSTADALFLSAAERLGPALLGLALSGMGESGLRGCAGILRAGGRVLVQDRHTSLAWGIPGSVARAGLPEREVPLHELARELQERAKHRDRGDGREQRAA